MIVIGTCTAYTYHSKAFMWLLQHIVGLQQTFACADFTSLFIKRVLYVCACMFHYAYCICNFWVTIASLQKEICFYFFYTYAKLKTLNSPLIQLYWINVDFYFLRPFMCYSLCLCWTLPASPASLAKPACPSLLHQMMGFYSHTELCLEQTWTNWLYPLL